MLIITRHWLCMNTRTWLTCLLWVVWAQAATLARVTRCIRPDSLLSSLGTQSCFIPALCVLLQHNLSKRFFFCMIACVYSCISSSAVCVFVLWSCLDIRRRSRCFPTMPMGFPRPTSRLRYRKISALPLAHLCNYHCKSVDLNRVNM